jgi:hypothetical protein
MKITWQENIKSILMFTLYIFAIACIPLIGFFSKELSNYFGVWFFSLGMIFSLIIIVLYMMNRHSICLIYGVVFFLGDASSSLFL